MSKETMAKPFKIKGRKAEERIAETHDKKTLIFVFEDETHAVSGQRMDESKKVRIIYEAEWNEREDGLPTLTATKVYIL